MTLLLLPLCLFNCPPLTAHLLLRYLSISGASQRCPPVLSLCTQVLVCAGISLLLVFYPVFLLASGLSFNPTDPLCFVLRESVKMMVSVVAGSRGGRGGRSVVSAGPWGWAASCSVRCCAVSGTLSGRPASPPTPPDGSPLCDTNSTHGVCLRLRLVNWSQVY